MEYHYYSSEIRTSGKISIFSSESSFETRTYTVSKLAKIMLWTTLLTKVIFFIKDEFLEDVLGFVFSQLSDYFFSGFYWAVDFLALNLGIPTESAIIVLEIIVPFILILLGSLWSSLRSLVSLGSTIAVAFLATTIIPTFDPSWGAFDFIANGVISLFPLLMILIFGGIGGTITDLHANKIKGFFSSIVVCLILSCVATAAIYIVAGSYDYKTAFDGTLIVANIIFTVLELRFFGKADNAE